MLISTYKLATVLEVDIDPEVRNKRKAAALEAITSLLNNTQEDGAEQKGDKKHHDKDHHDKKDHDKEHHDKKRKKKKHK